MKDEVVDITFEEEDCEVLIECLYTKTPSQYFAELAGQMFEVLEGRATAFLWDYLGEERENYSRDHSWMDGYHFTWSLTHLESGDALIVPFRFSELLDNDLYQKKLEGNQL